MESIKGAVKKGSPFLLFLRHYITLKRDGILCVVRGSVPAAAQHDHFLDNHLGEVLGFPVFFIGFCRQTAFYIDPVT
jgi:hypothetical protein